MTETVLAEGQHHRIAAARMNMAFGQKRHARRQPWGVAPGYGERRPSAKQILGLRATARVETHRPVTRAPPEGALVEAASSRSVPPVTRAPQGGTPYSTSAPSADSITTSHSGSESNRIWP